MHGLVTLLSEPYYHLVEDLWHKLDKECGLTRVRVTPFPNFSWQIAAGYFEPQTERAVRRIAARTHSFKVHTEGLGIFSGPDPVVQITIRRSTEMDRLHASLWRQFQGAAGLNPLYGPRNWMPHITLISAGETAKSLACGLQLLAFHPFHWELEVNNLAFVSQFDDQVGTLGYRHDFLPQA